MGENSVGGAGYLLGLLASAGFFVWVLFQLGKFKIGGRPPRNEAQQREGEDGDSAGALPPTSDATEQLERVADDEPEPR